MTHDASNGQVLQFDTADSASTTALRACATCKGALEQTYYEANGKAVCPSCHGGLLSVAGGGVGGFAPFARAAALGLAAALAGSVGWYAVRAVTGMELGIVAIGVGILVGMAVRRGAGHRGGWAYQLLAMFLTYNAATLNYAPDLLSALHNKDRTTQSAPAAQDVGAGRSAERAAAPVGLAQGLLAVATLYWLVLALPFLLGADNILGIFIIGIGVYEAWRINRRPQLRLSGPYQLGRAVGATASGG